jgi:valyl-tRNA synthetase
MVAWVRDRILALLHPFMPFITEELWTLSAEAEDPRATLLALAEWPSGPGHFDAKAEAEIGWVIDVVSAIRSVRAEMNVNVPLPLVLAGVPDQVWSRAQQWADFLKRMARLSEIARAPAYEPGTVQIVVRGETIGLALAGVIDLAAERARLDKEIAKAEADIKRVDGKLGNANFIANAPDEVVEG